MQIVEIVRKVLESGELPMSLEREIQSLLEKGEFDEMEMVAIDQLLDALCKGTIRSVPDGREAGRKGEEETL